MQLGQETAVAAGIAEQGPAGTALPESGRAWLGDGDDVGLRRGEESERALGVWERKGRGRELLWA
jgi:hypothetical protein